MYSIKCDDYVLYDNRDPELKVNSPKAKLEVNTVGEASFTIYHNHPYYDKLQYLKSVFEISDEIGVVFRGRMTNRTLDFYNGKAVDLEGAMAFFNDSRVRPFAFPDDFLNDADYISAAESGNVIEFFLKWLIDNHNSQVDEFQRFKLGVVTVTDPNNYLTRSNSKPDNTWNTLKSKLFDSSLGGYLCIRYEPDGNYIDYLSEFTLTNKQSIEFSKNLLDLKNESDASEVYTAIIPIGAEVEVDGVKSNVTIESLPNETIADDIVKSGDMIYSISARNNYGFICAPVADSTWEDVTEPSNLLNKAIERLTGSGRLLSNTIEVNAVDLHFSDAEIQSFRIYRNINVVSVPHNLNESYQLTKLDLDLQNPQNTKITVGKTQLTLTDSTQKNQANIVEKVEKVEVDVADNRQQISATQESVLEESTRVLSAANGYTIECLKDYVETSTFEEYQESVETEFSVKQEGIDMVFDKVTTVETEHGNQLDKLHKHISFTGENGIIIKMGNNEMALQLDNDIISFTQNGKQLGWWDGMDFHTRNIIITLDTDPEQQTGNERAQFGNFAFVPRSNGSLSLLKVGG